MKTYETTEEIKQLFAKGQAAEKCRDIAVKLFFPTRRAIKFAMVAEESYAKAWKLARDLYPDTGNGGWHYHVRSGEIREGLSASE